MLNGAVNIDDLRKLAKKRLPRIAYDFIEGGVEDEVGIDRNEQAFRELQLVPRYLVDVSKRDQTTTLFGRTYSHPFGIAPTGLASLFRHGADLMLAAAAKDANVPFIMSGSSTASIEDLARWDAALYDERLLKRASLDAAFTPATATDDATVEYGYGWRITGETLWHSGETIGFRNVIVRYPRRHMTVVLLTNRNDPEPYRTALAIAALVDPSVAPGSR